MIPTPASATTSIQAVIFDLGRVLVDYDWTRALRDSGRDFGMPPDEVKRRLFPGNAFDRFEAGELTPEQFHAEFESLLACKIPFERFCGLWNSIFTDEVRPVLELAERLKARGLPVAVLSNTNTLHADFLRGRLAWLRAWDHVYMSHEIRVRKPDAGAYRHVLERLGVAPAQAVFVDDMPKNIQAAEALGLRCVLATSPQAVLQGLAGWGVEA